MKKIALIIALFLITFKLFSQDCSQYIFMKKNRIIESTCYDEKGNILRKVTSTVADVTTTSGTTTATVVSEFLDKSGKPNGKRTIYYKCNGGKFMMDIEPVNQQKGDANVKLNVGSMEYPSGMKVGDHLNDVNSEMEKKIGGSTMVVNSQITDRTVVGKENITTPAGSWNCFKITYKTTVTMKGNKMPPQAIESTEWFAPNFGIIKFQLIGMTTEITGLR